MSSHSKQPKYDHSSGKEVAGVVVILDLHHEEVHCFHNHHHEELPHIHHEEVQVGVVPPIISLMAVLLHIRVKVPRHIEEVDLVATATALDTEIIRHHHHCYRHRVEILVIMIIRLCVRLLVGMGHLILEVAWILGQVYMTDMDPLLHSIAMTKALHPHLAHPTDILHPMEEVEVVGGYYGGGGGYRGDGGYRSGPPPPPPSSYYSQRRY